MANFEDSDATIRFGGGYSRGQDARAPRALRTGNGAVLAGRYRIERRLGAGGNGSVYLAQDLQLDGLRVALKMPPAALAADRRALSQLKKETLVAMKLTHPGIVAVRAFEENAGNPFIVMDFVEGRTLADLLDAEAPLSEADAVRILRPVAEALDYAHSAGVVHRDVKPSNIMLPEKGGAKLLDFGIAREIIDSMAGITGTARESSGTPRYMSPEQFDGAAPAPAQDVYSFAATVYECLRGVPPFVRGNLESQIKGKPPPPLPEGVAIAPNVMAALAKRPGERPATCAAVLKTQGEAASRRLQQGEAASSRLKSVVGEVPPPAKPGNGCGCLILAAAILAVAAVWVVMAYQRHIEERRLIDLVPDSPVQTAPTRVYPTQTRPTQPATSTPGRTFRPTVIPSGSSTRTNFDF